MKKVRYNGTIIYVDDSPLDESETGKIFEEKEDDELEKTLEVDQSLINQMLDDSKGEDNG